MHHHHHHHQSLNREGRWGTTDNFATSFLHFSLFSTALWDLPNSRPVYSLMLSSYLFLCPPCFLPPFTVPLQDGFGQTWWMENMTIPLQFASLCNRQEVFVWSICLLDLGTDFLVGNMVFLWDDEEMSLMEAILESISGLEPWPGCVTYWLQSR